MNYKRMKPLYLDTYNDILNADLPRADRIRFNNKLITFAICCKIASYIREHKPYKVDLAHLTSITSAGARVILSAAATHGVKVLRIVRIIYSDGDCRRETDLDVLLTTITSGFSQTIHHCNTTPEYFDNDSDDFFKLLESACKYKFRGCIISGVIDGISLVNIIGDFNAAKYAMIRIIMYVNRARIRPGKFILIKIFKHMCSLPIAQGSRDGPFKLVRFPNISTKHFTIMKDYFN